MFRYAPCVAPSRPLRQSRCFLFLPVCPRLVLSILQVFRQVFQTCLKPPTLHSGAPCVFEGSVPVLLQVPRSDLSILTPLQCTMKYLCGSKCSMVLRKVLLN